MGQKAKKIVPKKIGNVKVPKRLRKTVNKALANPKTAEVASGALLAIGTALARKTLGDRAAKYGFAPAEDAKPQGAGTAKPVEAVADIGALVAGAAGEAVRGVAGAVTRIVEEAVDTLKRDFGRGRDTEPTGSARPFANQDTEAGAQSEPAAPVEPAMPQSRLDGSETFGDRDDNDDPTDGNDTGKPGPMTGVGP